MAAPTRPSRLTRSVSFACPVCGEPAHSVDLNAGWVVTGLLGTKVGTYPDTPPNEPPLDGGGIAAPVEPFPPLDQWLVQPCGHRVSPDQAAEIRGRIAEQAQNEPLLAAKTAAATSWESTREAVVAVLNEMRAHGAGPTLYYAEKLATVLGEPQVITQDVLDSGRLNRG